MKTLKLLFFLILFQIVFVLNGSAEVIDYIVAIVDKEIITFSELKEKLDAYKKIYSSDDFETKLKQVKEKILNETIEDKILLISAENAKIEVTEEEIEKNLEEFKKEFSTPDKFYAELGKRGLTLSEFKEITKSRVKISKFVRSNIIRNIRITEEEIITFYEENKSAFLMSEQVKISQILIKDESNNEAGKIIEEVFQKLKSGEDFSPLAKSYSEEPNASGGGDLGFVYIEQLQPQIRKALLELKVGEFTKPILTSAGYHIVKLEAKKMSQYAPISEVKNLIKSKLYDLKASEIYAKWMKTTKENIGIIIFNHPAM
ncbi:MAG: peptidylprolyl isomerase [Candidatus Omnitrophica bacterium]|nr:peptidylprolyl isomerase [Candidatus Omnitrophota bacterium]MBU1047157.1 peptidylprolyl isomerase [Candidatus Omnitrophota bacterium]MBU1889565.1 peptidylprolyl isomerase [Candidatus Omnitrophota bacterium]